jgi:hypothetical protein
MTNDGIANHSLQEAAVECRGTAINKTKLTTISERRWARSSVVTGGTWLNKRTRTRSASTNERAGRHYASYHILQY